MALGVVSFSCQGGRCSRSFPGDRMVLPVTGRLQGWHSDPSRDTRSWWPTEITGANAGPHLSNKITSLAFILALLYSQANHSFHSCLLPVKFRGEPRALFGSPSFQSTRLYTASPCFWTSACWVIILFSPRDTILESEGSIDSFDLRTFWGS